MTRTARARRTSLRRAAAPILPDDLVVWEILVRLPAKTLLRCRAVCRSWRCLTSAADFLLAHHRRQPSLPLVSFRSRPRRRRDVADAALDAFDLRRSPAERRPVLRFNDYNPARPYRVHASCDGLLVLSLCFNQFYYICNPTMRQWISLPILKCCNVEGLYPHSSSGEYRILYWNGRQVDNNTLCYVLPAGSSTLPRGIAKYQATGLRLVKYGASVLLHGCLHWVHHGGEEVLVFDTAGESFRWMSAPTNDSYWIESHLVQMDSTLCISRINKSTTMMKLWMLQNYEAEVWLMKYQIELPVAEMRSISDCYNFYGMVLSGNGDVLVYCRQNSHLFHCDSKGKLVQKFQWNDLFSSWPTREWFKESLVQHALFQRKDGVRVRKPRFFQGL